MLTLCESLEGKLSWAWRGRSRRKAEEEPRCQEGRPPAGPPGAAGLGPQERDESRGRARPLLAADPSQPGVWRSRPAALGTPTGCRCGRDWHSAGRNTPTEMSTSHWRHIRSCSHLHRGHHPKLETAGCLSVGDRRCVDRMLHRDGSRQTTATLGDASHGHNIQPKKLTQRSPLHLSAGAQRCRRGRLTVRRGAVVSAVRQLVTSREGWGHLGPISRGFPDLGP
nr:uncharacterized protein LOC118967415 [Manis javanica]